MRWVIQENTGKEFAFDSLLENLEKFGQKYDLVKVVPFVGDIIPDVTETKEKVICFGSYSMRKLAIKKGWSPGVYDIEWFPYTSLVDILGTRVLNFDSVFGTFGDIKPKMEEFFIRPTHDGKEFAGTTMTREYFEDWQHTIIDLNERYNGATITSETPIMISSLKKIYNECRYFIVGGIAVTGSQYKLGNRVVYNRDAANLEVAQNFADKLSDSIRHPYVLDIAETPNGPKVVEINTLNCAGFYHCDMQKLVAALVGYEK